MRSTGLCENGKPARLLSSSVASIKKIPTPIGAAESELASRSMLGMDGESQQARAVWPRAQRPDRHDMETAVIVEVEATPARTYGEVAVTKTTITRTEERLRFKAKRLVADTAYGTGRLLGWLIEAGITPHIAGPCADANAHVRQIPRRTQQGRNAPCASENPSPF